MNGKQGDILIEAISAQMSMKDMFKKRIIIRWVIK
jgi:hypothetical protein